MFGCEKDDRDRSSYPLLVAGVAGVGGRDHDPQSLAFLLRRRSRSDSHLVGADLGDRARGLLQVERPVGPVLQWDRVLGQIGNVCHPLELFSPEP